MVQMPDLPAIQVYKNVIWALLMRETQTRFGRYNLGLLWALLVPLFQVLVFSIVFGFFLHRTIPGIPYPIFLLTGFVPFNMFRNTLMTSLGAIHSNQGLLVYNQICPLDPLVTRVVYEFLVFSVVMILFLVASVWLGLQPSLHQPLQIFTAVIALIMLTSGAGLIIGTLAHQHAELERIVPIFVRPLLFVSGVIHPFSAIPAKFQTYLLYNPLLHILETFRVGLFPHYPASDKINVFYPIALGIVMLTIGLALYEQRKDTLYDPQMK